MRALAFHILLVLGSYLLISPVRLQQLEPVTADKNVVAIELTLGSDGGYVWSDRSYQLSDLLSALSVQSKVEPFAQINLDAGADITVQNIIDVATLAKELTVAAYYYDGGELKSIEISE